MKIHLHPFAIYLINSMAVAHLSRQDKRTLDDVRTSKVGLEKLLH
jgi:hypothetical protein